MKKCLYCNKPLYLKTDPYVREYRKRDFPYAFYCRRCNKCFVNIEKKQSRAVRILYYIICLILLSVFFFLNGLNSGEELLLCLALIICIFGLDDILNSIFTGCMVECSCDENFQPIIKKSNYEMNVSIVKKKPQGPVRPF